MSNPTDPPAELFEHGRRLTLSQIVAMLLSRGGTEHSSRSKPRGQQTHEVGPANVRAVT